MGDVKRSPLYNIFNLEKAVHPEVVSKMADSEAISSLNFFKLIRVLKNQGKNPKIDQIRTMDARIRFHQDGLDSKGHGSHRRMFPARALSVIFSSDHESTPHLSRLFCKTGIHPLKDIF